jgi:hypothetical protein
MKKQDEWVVVRDNKYGGTEKISRRLYEASYAKAKYSGKPRFTLVEGEAEEAEKAAVPAPPITVKKKAGAPSAVSSPGEELTSEFIEKAISSATNLRMLDKLREKLNESQLKEFDQKITDKADKIKADIKGGSK